jgi:predicted ArsR family transcriptional regulator
VKRADRHAAQRSRTAQRRERILHCITTHGVVGTGDLTRELHLAPGGAMKDLRALEADGLVEHTKSRVGGGYVWSRS